MALLTWVKRDKPGRLAVMARPGRGRHIRRDLAEAADNGVNVLVSLLTSSEEKDFELEDERRAACELGMEFRRFSIPDRQTPEANAETLQFLQARLNDLEQGKSVAFHCSSGRGRTSLMAAALLVLEGVDPDTAFRRVRGHRLTPVPDTTDQRAWVEALAQHIVTRPRSEKGEGRFDSRLWVGAGVGVLLAFGLLHLFNRKSS